MMLHAADVSNCARPWDVYLKWVEPITEEFYRQGDSEAKAGLPVTPMMDRNNPIPTEKFQSGFINAIVLPLFKGLGDVPQLDLREPLLNISKNDAKWKQVRGPEGGPTRRGPARTTTPSRFTFFNISTRAPTCRNTPIASRHKSRRRTAAPSHPAPRPSLSRQTILEKAS